MSVQRVTIYSPRGTIGIRLGFLVYPAAREFVEASLGALMGGVLTGTKRVRPLFFCETLAALVEMVVRPAGHRKKAISQTAPRAVSQKGNAHRRKAGVARMPQQLASSGRSRATKRYAFSAHSAANLRSGVDALGRELHSTQPKRDLLPSTPGAGTTDVNRQFGEPLPNATMRIAFLCKRRYMAKDVIVDRYARLYEIPRQLANLGPQVLGLRLSYYGDEEGEWSHETDAGELHWVSRSLGRTVLPRLLGYSWRALTTARDFAPDIDDWSTIVSAFERRLEQTAKGRRSLPMNSGNLPRVLRRVQPAFRAAKALIYR